MTAPLVRRLTRRRTLTALALVPLGVPLGRSARANEKSERLPELRESMARFAQPVRVGDLAARYLLEPAEAQRVLGRVAALPVLRTAAGDLLLAVDRGGVLGFGTTRVAVPLDDVALLGEHVVLIGLTPAALAALPRVASNGLTPVPVDTRVRVAIVGPFH